MQYGALSASEIAKFESAQGGRIRKPTFVVWLEGFGDPSEYVISIDTEVALEWLAGILNVGKAIIIADNGGSYFYDGKSKIDRYARIKIWAGFSGLNIPIFTGVVDSVKPTGTEYTVELDCVDCMGLFENILIKGNQEPNNTAKLLMEYFSSEARVLSDILSSDETSSVYSNPYFDECNLKVALEEICRSIFHIAYFDENGYLQAKEREYKNRIDFVFRDGNVRDCETVSPTNIINEIEIEYGENFFAKFSDQASIDEYGRKSGSERTLLLNSQIISSKSEGSTTEELNYALEGFKLTSQAGSSIVDCIHVKMRQSGAHGYMTAKVYDDNSGLPGTLLGTSQLKASANLSIFFSWEIFYFATPVDISALTDYWIVIDTTSVSEGSVYTQISAAAATGKHAYYDTGAWHTEDNKQVLHHVCGSREAQRVARDCVEFYKESHERIRISAPAVPQLQLLDEVFVDIELRDVRGYYVIEGRRQIITPEYYTTIDTLRKVA